MYMNPDETNDEMRQVVAAGILSMLQQAKDRFNTDGCCSPQAYILLPDAEVCHYVSKPESFDADVFADYIEKRVIEERGVAVLSIAETWVTDDWDGTCCVSENADSYEALAATLEVVGDETFLYTWPIQRDANGTARIDQPRPHIRCDAGLFRLRTFRKTARR